GMEFSKRGDQMGGRNKDCESGSDVPQRNPHSRVMCPGRYVPAHRQNRAQERYHVSGSETLEPSGCGYRKQVNRRKRRIGSSTKVKIADRECQARESRQQDWT